MGPGAPGKCLVCLIVRPAPAYDLVLKKSYMKKCEGSGGALNLFCEQLDVNHGVNTTIDFRLCAHALV